MKKKLTAFLTALLCLGASSAALPVGAVDYTPLRFTVVGITDTQYIAVAMDMEAQEGLSFTFDKTSVMTEMFGTEENFPKVGDVIEIECANAVYTDAKETRECSFEDVKRAEIIGEIGDFGTNELYLYADSTFTDNDGNQYTYYLDFYDWEPELGTFADLAGLADEAVVGVITYNDIPIVPLEILMLPKNTSDFAVIGVLDGEDNYGCIVAGYGILKGEIFKVRSSEMEAAFGSDKKNHPAVGDIFRVDSTDLAGVSEYLSFGKVKSAEIIGSVLDDTDCRTFTYIDDDSIVDEQGKSYYYPSLYIDGYGTGDAAPNPADAKSGDQLVMTMRDGKPILCVGINPLGDVNADNKLNVLDVIVLNKSIMTGSDLPALSRARTGEEETATDFGQCDFNGNGTIDVDDALGMLKRIIGIDG